MASAQINMVCTLVHNTVYTFEGERQLYRGEGGGGIEIFPLLPYVEKNYCMYLCVKLLDVITFVQV